MVSRVSTERMRIRKIRINPLATRDLAEKHVLKLVEGFFWSLSGCLRATFNPKRERLIGR